MNTSFPFAKAIQVLAFVFLFGSVTAEAQTVTNYVDDFNGPTLDDKWRTNNPSGDASFDGFMGSGYQISFPAVGSIPDSGLEISLDGGTNDPGDSVINSFTIDASVELSNFTGQNGFFKFRFFGGQFMEVVYDYTPTDDNIRVFSAEVGGNLVSGVPVGLPDGGTLNLRLNRDVTSGTVVVGFSVGTNDLQVLASTSGLQNFTPHTCDIVMNKSGLNFITPTMVIDRYEQRDGVFGISIDPFTDSFDGPTLDPSWDLIQSAPADHVGFIGAGLYEVKKTNTTGEAGLSRDFGGQDTFSSSVRFQMQDFNGSESQVEFRSPTTAGGIIVTLNSSNDITVSAEGSTVEELTNFGYQDGETLEFQVSVDALTGDAQVGLSRNDGTLLRIANLTGLSDVPTNNQIVVIKNAAGNGNSPRLLLDEYSISEGLNPIAAAAYTDDFTGPTLDSGWIVSDTGVGSHLGYNGAGQYEISPQAVGVQAGVRRFLGLAGDGATLDLRARLNDFAGSESEVRFQIPGPIGASVIIKSNGDLDVVTAVSSTTIYSEPSGISDGDLFDLRLTLDLNPTNLYEVGLGINGAPLTFLVDDFNVADLDDVQVEVLITKNAVGNGNTPVLVLDRFSSFEGVSLIPGVPNAYSDDFSGPVLEGNWVAAGLTPLGFTNGAQFVLQVDTSSPVTLTRFLEFPVPSGFPVGSFTAELDVQFLDMVGTTNEAPAGAGTDFKFRALGGNLMEIVFNSFRTVRFFTQNNGQSWFQDTLTDFEDGDTVNFLMAYDASVPSVTMSVGLNGGPPVFKETLSGLVGVAPQQLEIRGFRFNFDNPGLTPQFLLDQLDINPGLGALPGTLTIGWAYGGRIQIGWDSGTLRSATVIDGVYTNVPMATSPYLQFPTETQEYFQTIGD